MTRWILLLLGLLVAGASPAAAAPPATLAQACPSWARALARARAATAAKRWKAAVEAYDAALESAPYDVQTLAERGWAKHLANDPRVGDDAEHDLQQARIQLAGSGSLTAADRTLLGMIWFNLGLVYERELAALEKRRQGGETTPDLESKLAEAAEKARAALALSASLGSAAARKRLGRRPACTAIRRTSGEGEPPEIVSSWRALVPPRRRFPGTEAWSQLVARSRLDLKRSEADARRAVCTERGEDALLPLAKACPGQGPWTIKAGYMHFSFHSLHVLPLPRGRLAYLTTFGGGGRGGTDSLSWKLRGDHLEIAESVEDTTYGSNPATRSTPEELPAGFCKASLAFVGGSTPSYATTKTTIRYHDVRTGTVRLVLEPWGSTAITATIRGNVATLSGGGCDGTIPLGKP